MSTPALNPASFPFVNDACVVILTSKWHAKLVQSMESHCRQILTEHGVSEVVTHELPGTLEMPYAANKLAKLTHPDAIVCLSVVEKGSTAHFDMIIHATTKALIAVSIDRDVPIVNEIVAVTDYNDAVERASDDEFNKGIEAAAAALDMIVFDRCLTRG